MEVQRPAQVTKEYFAKCVREKRMVYDEGDARKAMSVRKKKISKIICSQSHTSSPKLPRLPSTRKFSSIYHKKNSVALKNKPVCVIDITSLNWKKRADSCKANNASMPQSIYRNRSHYGQNTAQNSSPDQPKRIKKASITLINKNEAKSSMFYTTDNNSIEAFTNNATPLCFPYTAKRGEEADKSKECVTDLSPEPIEKQSIIDQFDSDFSKTLSLSDDEFDKFKENLYEAEINSEITYPDDIGEEIDASDNNIATLTQKILKTHRKKELESRNTLLKINPFNTKKSQKQLGKAQQDSINCTEIDSSLCKVASKESIQELFFPLRKESFDEDSSLIFVESILDKLSKCSEN
ncbi:unnamed protein product [Moneuplotes crassus]|uniref:Uncharacterized protein n=1 Tax=Euplotes crassus TaxID=5936 RepID=A0AAD2D505_EUPCR|nr:unnamed protein product [Moneuplotes crassus]